MPETLAIVPTSHALDPTSQGQPRPLRRTERGFISHSTEELMRPLGNEDIAFMVGVHLADAELSLNQHELAEGQTEASQNDRRKIDLARTLIDTVDLSDSTLTLPEAITRQKSARFPEGKQMDAIDVLTSGAYELATELAGAAHQEWRQALGTQVLQHPDITRPERIQKANQAIQARYTKHAAELGLVAQAPQSQEVVGDPLQAATQSPTVRTSSRLDKPIAKESVAEDVTDDTEAQPATRAPRAAEIGHSSESRQTEGVTNDPVSSMASYLSNGRVLTREQYDTLRDRVQDLRGSGGTRETRIAGELAAMDNKRKFTTQNPSEIGALLTTVGFDTSRIASTVDSANRLMGLNSDAGVEVVFYRDNKTGQLNYDLTASDARDERGAFEEIAANYEKYAIDPFSETPTRNDPQQRTEAVETVEASPASEAKQSSLEEAVVDVDETAPLPAASADDLSSMRTEHSTRNEGRETAIIGRDDWLSQMASRAAYLTAMLVPEDRSERMAGEIPGDTRHIQLPRPEIVVRGRKTGQDIGRLLEFDISRTASDAAEKSHDLHKNDEEPNRSFWRDRAISARRRLQEFGHEKFTIAKDRMQRLGYVALTAGGFSDSESAEMVGRTIEGPVRIQTGQKPVGERSTLNTVNHTPEEAALVEDQRANATRAGSKKAYHGKHRRTPGNQSRPDHQTATLHARTRALDLQVGGDEHEARVSVLRPRNLDNDAPEREAA